MDRLNLTSVLVAFSERRERHELLTSIQELFVQRGVKAGDPSPDDGAKIKAACGDDWLAVGGNARHQLHPQMFGIGCLVVQNADQLSDGLIFKMTIVVAEVMRRENQRKISISLQKDRRWRDVIPILLIAILKRLSAEVAEREFLGGSYGLLRSQFDRHETLHARLGQRSGPSLIVGKISPVEVLAGIAKQLQEHAIQKTDQKAELFERRRAGGTFARSSAVPPWQ